MVQVLWLRLLQVMGVSAPPSPWLPPAEPAASLVSPDCCWTPPTGFCWWQGKRAAHPLPLPSEAPLERVTLCPLLGVSLSEAEGIRQQSTRTRLPRDDQFPCLQSRLQRQEEQ